MSTPPRMQVFYDGGCPVCSHEIAFYRQRPGADGFDWVDVQRAEQPLGTGLSREVALARMHVRLPDGTLLSGAPAFAAMWRNMPGLGWLGRWLQVPHFGALAEIEYRIFLLVRRAWRAPRRPRMSARFSSRLSALVGTLVLMSTNAWASMCPAFLNHDFTKLYSSETVNIGKVYAGKPLLIVNTASHCGYTPQLLRSKGCVGRRRRDRTRASCS